MINYNFTASTEAYDEAINALLRMDVGLLSGGELASIYYKNIVQGLSVSDMKIKNAGYREQVRYVVRANGSYAANKQLFDYCLTYCRDQLDRLFHVETVLAPEQEG